MYIKMSNFIEATVFLQKLKDSKLN